MSVTKIPPAVDTAALRRKLPHWDPYDSDEAWAASEIKDALPGLLDRLEYLESIPRKIEGLVACAEASDASERATLLLKLAAAEQRIAELERRCKCADAGCSNDAVDNMLIGRLEIPVCEEHGGIPE